MKFPSCRAERENLWDGAVIFAASGMCTGGRVRPHLLRHLGRGDASVIFVGFAKGALARQIIAGAADVTTLPGLGQSFDL
jgi:metallo-beta-lactamase family protein